MTPHEAHRGINGRGYRMAGCMECELRYRMAWRDPEPPDSALESMAVVAVGVVVLLAVYVLSGAELMWPVPR